MKKSIGDKTIKKSTKGGAVKSKPWKLCGVTPEPARVFGPTVSSDRAGLILLSSNKWTNGTVLHYHFLNSPAKWKGSELHKKLVRRAFDTWKQAGIGLEFREVSDASEAEIRIGFEKNDGHWSYIGRGVLQKGKHERTMNLDKADQLDIDTPVHEIGHTLGFPHAHQNPNAGIEWNEEKVYEDLAKAPNFWSKEKTHYNIIRKLDPNEVEGSNWDPDSIMHYFFEKGQIKSPSKYQTQDLIPAPGLSSLDKKWVKRFTLNYRPHLLRD